MVAGDSEKAIIVNRGIARRILLVIHRRSKTKLSQEVRNYLFQNIFFNGLPIGDNDPSIRLLSASLDDPKAYV